MSVSSHSIVIRAEAEPLFALTQDYRRRLDWDPFLKEARLLDGASTAAVDAKAWCVARSGLGMETQYVTVIPPRVTAVKMTRGPAFLTSFAGSWRFLSLEPGATRVTFCYHLESRPRWLRWLLDPVLHCIFARDTHQRLRALKRAAETTDILSCYQHDHGNHHFPDRPPA